MRLSLPLTGAMIIATLLAGSAVAGDVEDCLEGQPEACSRIIEQVGQPADKLAGAYSLRATYYLLNNDAARSMADFDQAIRFDPNHAEAYFGRGRAHQVLGRLDAAIADWDAAIGLDPRHVNALISRGAIHALKGEMQQAFADHDRAIEADPNNAAAWGSRGSLNLVTSRFAQATKDLDRA
ncbi:MAG TPA: tetratricopeptide repeat protein, partial [Aestuariivirgaceae bacterium]|nr:tetratricopeptide repeat protein [Aestuariivirgaceae bacterium]